MKQRATLIALALACLVTVVGLVELWGWEESEREPETARRPAPERPAAPVSGCFNIIMHPKYSPAIPSGRAFLLDGCTGNTWAWIPDNEEIAKGVWFPVRKY